MKKVLILKHVAQEGPGTIGTCLQQRGVSSTVLELGQGAPVPHTLAGYDALMVMGGPMNVYEEARYPFLIDEDRLIRQALAERVPYLGLCLGAQLLAKAADARVYKAPVEEIGWCGISLTPAGTLDALFDGVEQNLQVFQWHGDTFDVPTGGQLLATATACPAQAFKAGVVAYGLQFHVETDAALIDSWMTAETAARREEIGRATAVNSDELRATAECITDNFIKIMH